MRILVYTGYDNNPRYREMGDYSSGNKLIYSQKHNYSFLCERSYEGYNRNISWFKIKRIMDEMFKYDWIFWSDADSLIANLDIKIEDIINLPGKDSTHVMVPEREELKIPSGDKFFVVSDDEWANLGPCLGGFLIKSCPIAYKFLQDIYNTTEFEEGPWWDQHAAHKFWKQDRDYSAGLKVVSRVFLNSFSDYKPNAFMIHDKFHFTNGRVVPK